jgi:hypothetical protein
MKIIYRISDGGNIKQKPYYVQNKSTMFLHFINIFKNYDIYVFADNVKDDTYNFLINNYDASKIFRTSLGNEGTFIHTVNFAIENFSDNEKIYFAEDDYIYTNVAPKIIEEGLNIADYSSGYDHPDKYMNHNEGGPNPFIENGGELTRVLITDNSHWKLTNSCCMTFATTIKIIKEDYETLKKFGVNDFGLFCDLIQCKKRKLVSCIPAVSTHGESQWLSKFIDWEKEFLNSFMQ